ncbi:MAG: hypothetical protein V4561_06780 [Bacteroidota bacterium]
MRKYIQAICPKSITDAFTLQLNSSLTLFNGYKINLTDDEKLGGRTMAEGREGYARLVSRVAIQFPSALSRADNPLELSNLLDAYQNLEGNRLALMQALETIEEMQLGAASDIMVLVDRYVANLQISRSNEASLDGAMKEIDDWNKRFAHKANSEE